MRTKVPSLRPGRTAATQTRNSWTAWLSATNAQSQMTRASRLSLHGTKITHDWIALEESRKTWPRKGRALRTIRMRTASSVNSLRSPLHDASASTSSGRKLTTLSASATQTVFETAELLEMITVLLRPKDILTVQQVGLEWRDAVNGSLRLKRKLGVELDMDCVPYHSPLEVVSVDEVFPLLFYCKNEDESRTYEHDSWAEIRTSVERTLNVNVMLGRPGKGNRLRVGSRCRLMRLCYPPLKRAQISYFLRYKLLMNGGYGTTTLDRPDGITVGDLLDVADGKYLEAKCLEPAIGDVSLLIYGSIELSEQDPIVQRRKASIAREAASHEGMSMSPATGF